MPAHDEHRQADLEFLGKDFKEVHEYMDYGPGGYGDLFILHRFHRHDPVKTAKEAEALFGPGAGDAVRLHELMDNIQLGTVAQGVGWLVGFLAFSYGAFHYVTGEKS